MAAPAQAVSPRRLAAAAATPATRPSAGAVVVHRTEEIRDWSLLVPDAVREIADKLLAADVTEYMRLRAVCTPWRSATADPRLLRPQFLPRNWLMLREELVVSLRDDEEQEGEDLVAADDAEVPAPEEGRRFLNVRTGATLRIRLPPAEEYGEVLTSGGAEGLLLLRSERTDTVRILNPLTSAMAVLPGLRMLVDGVRPARFVSAGVVFDGDSPTVLLVGWIQGTEGSKTLLYAKLGDSGWGTVDISCVLGGGDRFFHGGLSFWGQFYASTRHGDLLKVVLAPRPHLVYLARHHDPATGCTCGMPGFRSFLVPSLEDDADNNDGMLLVHRYGWRNAEAWEVFDVHVGRSRIAPRLVLGNCAVFLPLDTLRVDRFPKLYGAVYRWYTNIQVLI